MLSTPPLIRRTDASVGTQDPLSRLQRALLQPYDLTGHPLLERQSARESSARTYPRRIPLALRRGRGIYVEDVAGRLFIDCLAGAGTLALGHNHPVVVEAIRRTLDDELPLHTLDLTTPVKDEFVETLFELLPPRFARDARIQFCGPTGADAIEAALKLVKIATGRQTLLAFQGGYHGMTQGALQLMGNLGPKAALGGAVSGVQFLPYPYAFRSPFGLDAAGTSAASLHYIDQLLADPEGGVPRPAGLVTELIQGEGGVIPAPDDWTRQLRRITEGADVPLIIDEVQTGFGRTGRMFAFEHAGIEPDVLVLSKAIGGSLPLSVVVYRGRLDRWTPGAHAGTFRGNQLAMAAGTATLRHLQQEQLAEHAAAMGARLNRALLELQRVHSGIGEVRGRGLMLGMELVDPAGATDPLGRPLAAPERAVRLQRACLERGLIVELGGRHGSVLRLLPPLIITEREVDAVVEIIGESMKTL
ncbi:diaminobutyrate--2-oxoglutarate transaminase [Roseateles sp.]|uniref:diaminobutyrate--2-oxoglutarate transaminase n=1 Tax=Roseateles sp. TaxID=1971397 RepID=UPI0039ECB969